MLGVVSPAWSQSGGLIAQGDKVAGAGFQCPVMPSGFYRAGTLFRVEDRVPEIVKRSEGDPTIKVFSEPASMGSFAQTRAWDTHALLELIGLNIKPEVGVRVTTQAALTYDVTKLEGTDDDTVDQVTNRFQADVRKGVHTLRPNAKYYIVREAILAQAVDVDLRHDDGESIGGAVTLKKIAEIGASVSTTGNSKFIFKKRFATPLRVCIKPERVFSRLNASGGTDLDHRPLAKGEALDIGAAP